MPIKIHIQPKPKGPPPNPYDADTAPVRQVRLDEEKPNRRFFSAKYYLDPESQRRKRSVYDSLREFNRSFEKIRQHGKVKNLKHGEAEDWDDDE